MIFMLANNNKKVIDKLAKHTLKNSGKKYIILGIAVFLSTFMLLVFLPWESHT